MSVNKAIVIGEVITRPELIQTEDGPMCEFHLKTEDDETFHVKATAKRAEIICRYYREKLCIYVEGPMHTNQGNDPLARETMILVHDFQFIGASRGNVNVPY